MPKNGYQIIIDPVLLSVRQMLPAFCGMKPCEGVLDVCCGTGAQVIEYARQGLLTTGVDNSAAMVNAGIKEKRGLGLENACFYLADATALPFEDNCFDHVSISFGLHDKEKAIRNRVVAEIKRVVKKDGSVVLVDFNIPLPNNFWALLARSIEFMAGGTHYRGFKDFTATGGLKSILHEHGLTEHKSGNFKSGIVKVIQAKLDEE